MSRSVTVPRRARRVEEQQQPTAEQQQHCVPDSRDSDSGAAARCRRGRRGRLEGRPADPAGAAAACALTCAPRPRGVVLRVCSSVSVSGSSGLCGLWRLGLSFPSRRLRDAGRCVH